MEGVIGAIFGAIATLLVGFATWKISKKSLFAKTVSESRNVWLNEMREHISGMLAEANKTQTCYKTKEYYVHRNQVITRLNMGEPLHAALYERIRNLDNCTDENYEKLERDILLLSQETLKIEWERVKSEARRGE